MTYDPDYVKQRARTLYEEINARKLFRDMKVEDRTRTYRIQIAPDPEPAQKFTEDDEFPSSTMQYEEVEIPIEGQYSQMTPELHREHEDPYSLFDQQWVRSFTGPIRREIKDNIEQRDLSIETPNEIPFEAFFEGRMDILERSNSDPTTMLISDELADEILDDSVFDEWEVIKRDAEDEFGIDVYRDRFGALYGNEVLLADVERLGYELHAKEPWVEERGMSINAKARTGYCITDPEVGVRLAVRR